MDEARSIAARTHLSKRMGAEAIGTAFLLAGVVGSGIMAERLAGGNTAVALLANSVATGGVLVALILAFAGVSGAHLNPLVTLAAAAQGELPWRSVPGYVLAQCAGAIVGVMAANAMFDMPLVEPSHHVRSGAGQLLGEVIATVGLLAVIRGCRAYGVPATAVGVAAFIVAGYWFTSSTSFANPAVTIARCLTDTFTGIRPSDAPGFILAQAAGLMLVVLSTRKWSVP